MARIRTIKPEFPQSESMGRISRDARLCFIQMWTLADDEGRLRGNSRMLASLLFPYDDDARDLIEGWISELESADCIVRYSIEGDTYIQICKWLIHQKIDKPSKSKIPPFDESSRILANPRGGIKDQGSRIKDQGEEAGSPAAEPPPPVVPGKPSGSRKKTFATYLAECKEAGVKPIPDDHHIRRYCRDVGIADDMVALAWVRFKEVHLTGTRKRTMQIDWPETFANSVKDRWYRFWVVPAEGPATWTSEGLQHKRAVEAQMSREQGDPS